MERKMLHAGLEDYPSLPKLEPSKRTLLSSIGIVIGEFVESDGSCGFNAVANALRRIGVTHPNGAAYTQLDLRNIVAASARQANDDILPHLEGARTREMYADAIVNGDVVTVEGGRPIRVNKWMDHFSTQAIADTLNVNIVSIRVDVTFNRDATEATGIRLLRHAVINPQAGISGKTVLILHETERHYTGDVIGLVLEPGGATGQAVTVAQIIGALEDADIHVHDNLFMSSEEAAARVRADVAAADASSIVAAASAPAQASGGASAASEQSVKDAGFYYQELMNRRGSDVRDLIGYISRMTNMEVFKLVNRLCAGRFEDVVDTKAWRAKCQKDISSAIGPERTIVVGDAIRLQMALRGAVNIMKTQHITMRKAISACEVSQVSAKHKSALIGFLDLLGGTEDRLFDNYNKLKAIVGIETLKFLFYISGAEKIEEHLGMSVAHIQEQLALLVQYIEIDEGVPTASHAPVQQQEAEGHGLATATAMSLEEQPKEIRIVTVKTDKGVLKTIEVEVPPAPVLHLSAVSMGGNIVAVPLPGSHGDGGPDGGGGGSSGGVAQAPAPNEEGHTGGLPGGVLNVTYNNLI